MNVAQGIRLQITPFRRCQPEVALYVVEDVYRKEFPRVHMPAEFRYSPQAFPDTFDVGKRPKTPEALGRQRRMGPTGQVIEDFVEFQRFIKLIQHVSVQLRVDRFDCLR